MPFFPVQFFFHGPKNLDNYFTFMLYMAKFDCFGCGAAVIGTLWLIPILSQMKKLNGVAADHLVLLVVRHAGEVALDHSH